MTCPCNLQQGGRRRLTKKAGGKRKGKGKGYQPTERNLFYLRKYKKGKSIGFTMRSSLKAKGLIPRSDGTYRVSAKYQGL
jgi:hypothetical protein